MLINVVKRDDKFIESLFIHYCDEDVVRNS